MYFICFPFDIVTPIDPASLFRSICTVLGVLGDSRIVLVATSPLPESPILFISTIVSEVGIFDSNVNVAPLLVQLGWYSRVPSRHSSSTGFPAGPV